MNLQKIHTIYKTYEQQILDIKKGLTDEQHEHRTKLHECCNLLGLEQNNEGRMLSYKLLSGGDVDSYLAFLDKKDGSHIFKNFSIAYDYRTKYVMSVQNSFIEELIEKEELTPFYKELFLGMHKIGLEMNNLYKAWKEQTIYNINKHLEEKFDNKTETIISFLKENNLLDKDTQGNVADMCYTTLFFEDNIYTAKTYATAYPEISKNIVKEIDSLLDNILELDDPEFHQWGVYQTYIKALKAIYEEVDAQKLYEKYVELEQKWMNVNGPIQIAHSFEYYEDIFRKSVSIEFDMRIDDFEMMDSRAKEDVKNLYENIKASINDEKDSYKHIFDTTEKILDVSGLHIGNAPLTYGSRTTSAYSAQVIPNNEFVSKNYGKKIFALPESVLESQRNAPFMKMDADFLDPEFLTEYRKFLFFDTESYYNIYDITTIGHEFGHILWCDEGTEAEMNATGHFKNIEEWKATASGMIAYFISGKGEEHARNVIMTNLHRAVKILRYKKIDDVVPYYCEVLLHLEAYVASNMLVFEDGKAVFNFHTDVYEDLQTEYMKMYTFLVDTYLHKKDASAFLLNYTKQENGYIMPKNEGLYAFVTKYQEAHESYGNEIDTSNVPEDYLL